MNHNKIIDDYIQKQREDRQATSFHISRLGLCPRKSYLMRLPDIKKEPTPVSTLINFGIGHYWHDLYREALSEEGYEPVCEYPVEDGDWHGKIDFIVKDENGKGIIELKTAHPFAFDKYFKNGLPIDHHYILQLTEYYLLLNKKEKIDWAKVCIRSKADGRSEEIMIWSNDVKPTTFVVNTINLLKAELCDAWEAEKIPSVLPMCKGKWNWECSSCEYRGSYCQQELDKQKEKQHEIAII